MTLLWGLSRHCAEHPDAPVAPLNLLGHIIHPRDRLLEEEIEQGSVFMWCTGECSQEKGGVIEDMFKS